MELLPFGRDVNLMDENLTKSARLIGKLNLITRIAKFESFDFFS